MEKYPTELQFVSTSEAILRILQKSKDTGNAIAISSPLLGTGLFITAVERLIRDYEIIVVLKTHDVMGAALQRAVLKLTDIVQACAFNTRFEHIQQETPESQLIFQH